MTLRPRLKITISLAFTLLCSPVWADNYASCLLDLLPGLENDVAAIAARQVCLNKFPRGLDSVNQGSGRGLLAFNSGATCAYKKAKDTRSQSAAYQIRAACNRLYNEDAPWLEH